MKNTITNFLKRNATYILIWALLLLMGCSIPAYKQLYSTPKGVNFSEYTYYLGTVDSPYSDTEDLVLKILGGYNVNPISYQGDARSMGNIIPQNIDFEIRAKDLEILRIGSKFDFLIQIRVGNPESGYYDSTSLIQNDRMAVSSAYIKIIEIKTGAIAYDQKVLGESRSDLSKPTLTSSLKSLTHSALRKGLKDLKKYSKF